jgi:hypothetical protein
MSDTNFRVGDSLWSLTRKILETLNGTGSAGGGGGSTGITVTVANGANTAEGSTTDAAATDSTSAWSIISLLKGLYAKLAGTLTVGGNVGGITKVFHVHPTVNTAAYVAGNTVGAIQTLTGAVRVSGGTAILESIHIIDRANQKAAFDILIFESNPTAATTTDHAAFAWSTDDLKLIGHVAVSASDYVTVASEAVAHETSLGIALQAVGSANLYVVAVTSGTPDYVAATDLQFTYGFLQD